MRETTIKNKRLGELSFDDLYMDDDELYPNIRLALGKLKTKLKNRKNPFVHTGESENEKVSPPPHATYRNHPKRTGHPRKRS